MSDQFPGRDIWDQDAKPDPLTPDGAEDFVLEIAYGGDSPETVIYHVTP